MSVVWGGNGTLRVGINVFADGFNTFTPSINVYVDVWVGSDNYDYDDDQHLQLSGSFSQGLDFHNSLPYKPGAEQYLGRWLVDNQAQSYNGGPTYNFTAQISGAFNGAAPSVSTSFTLPARPKRAPNAPGTPWATNVTSSSASVQWNNPSDMGGGSFVADRLQVATDSGFSGVVYDKTGSGVRSVTGLSPGRTYWMRSATQTNVAWSPWSGTGSFTTRTTTPSAPGTPSFSAVTATKMTIGWSASTATGGSAITGYRLQVSTVSTFSSLVSDTTANDRQRSLSNLAPGDTYYARVLAVNAVGNSAWSSTKSITLASLGSNPPKIVTILPDKVTVTLGTLSDSGATGYQLQVDDDSAFGSPITVTGSGYSTTTPITVTGLSPSRSYWVRSRANTANGYGSWSGSVAFQTMSGARAMIKGIWVNTAVYAGVGGKWVPVKVYKRVGGQWVL